MKQRDRTGARGRLRFGFTLVEMLVVIAIIGVLAALLMPSLRGALLTTREIACRNNLRQVLVIEHSYAGDYNGRVCSGFYWTGTAAKSWASFLIDAGYVNTPAVLVCPGYPPADGLAPGEYSNEFRIYGVPKLYNGGWTMSGMPSSGISDGLFLVLPKIRMPSRLFLNVDSVQSTTGRQWYYIHPTTYLTENAGIHLRHQTRACLAFVDGHVEGMRIEQINALGVMKFISEDLQQISF